MMKKFKQNDNNYAIAYYRFSSHAQNEASIEQQREQAMRYAKEHGLIIIKEYSDKAITGTTDERPGFQQMLAEVGTSKSGKVHYYYACKNHRKHNWIR